ncbi:DNA replication initiation control protein YabA [Enterococcus nangangensis]|uniref:DNA replication initiation control protein YabA n=1 Tax=Enterococcus nangangensis TaxID=2559926 RepID=UPI0010F66B79|nr:DNA replication initiation control protein YabA [Enterococcus nangangensis]
MDNRSLYDSFDQLEVELSTTMNQLLEIKESLQKLVEKNAELELENQHLRQHLEEIDNRNATPSRQELSRSRMNLEKLYEEGIHVCNVFYGQRRKDDESCAFCLDVIYGERSK